MGLEIIIGAICLAAIAGITSYCSQRRNNQDREEAEDDATTVDITNTIIETTGPNGVTTTTTTQRITIEDFDKSKVKETETIFESGKENGVASTIASAASGGFGAVAGALSSGMALSASTLLKPSNERSDSETLSAIRVKESSEDESLNNSKVLDLIKAATTALEDGDLSAEEMQGITAIAISGDSDTIEI